MKKGLSKRLVLNMLVVLSFVALLPVTALAEPLTTSAGIAQTNESEFVQSANPGSRSTASSTITCTGSTYATPLSGRTISMGTATYCTEPIPQIGQYTELDRWDDAAQAYAFVSSWEMDCYWAAGCLNPSTDTLSPGSYRLIGISTQWYPAGYTPSQSSKITYRFFDVP